VTETGELLWEPPADVRATTTMGRFLDWVHATRKVALPDYDSAWRWSVEDPEAFWWSIWEFFEIRAHAYPTQALADAGMPGARWFPGARLNYAEHALRHEAARRDEPAIVARSQTREEDVTVTWGELSDQVARCAAGLRRLGVAEGDRVVGYLPNIPETIVAFLACASLGAIWSSCAPEFGTRAVIDRVQQIEPKVLLAVDGYVYGSKRIERAEELAEIRAQLPSLEATVLLGYLDPDPDPERFGDVVPWSALLAEPAELEFASLEFDHPLYVLFSSGTTGLPKAIIHGHGGILLEHCKKLGLHHDLGPEDRFFWFTTTGWMMWNYLASALVVDSQAVLFDGDPGHPDLLELWRLAADTGVTVFGVSAPFLLSCRAQGLRPGDELDLSAIRSVGSTGAPLPAEGFGWVYDAVGRDLLLASASGGTDVCTAFVGPSPLLEVRAGEIQARALGCRVEAFDEAGRSVIGQRGELVITLPMPSMPVGFYNDPDGERYRAAYFDEYPGVWRHGDWIEITERGSCVITGRSDATLNRGGVRMGTAEFYAVVEDVDGIVDSLVVHHTDPAGGPGELVLFVVLEEGLVLDDERRRAIATAVREEISPRHVPDDVQQIPEVPRTISGKKMEVPVKRILEGEPLAEVANPGAMANPGSLEVFRRLAAG
jgi:acetoacetyl-CoA synthetase